MNPRPLLLLLLASLIALLVAAPAAPAATAKPPSISKVSPMRVKVGSTLTIKGKNFSSKRTRNTVFFRGAGGKSALVKPKRASRTKLVVKVPASVGKLLSKRNGAPVATRLKLRVLAGKFGKYTSARLSPVVTSEGLPGGSVGGPTGSGGSTGGTSVGSGEVRVTCPVGDADNDLLSSDTETAIGTNPCDADSDNDGVQDGFEYQSARDLNDDEHQTPNSYLPYPGRRPYANPLDPSDANTDYDGDSMTLGEEYTLWNYTVSQGATRTLTPLTYSDGEQYSVFTRGGDGHRNPSLAASGYAKQTDFLNWATAAGYRQVELLDGSPWYSGSSRNQYGLLDFNRVNGEETTVPAGYFSSETQYYDFDEDGLLSDDERDEDADGLTNYDEQHGRMRAAYWQGCYSQETPYAIVYNDLNYLDPDTDGDGVRDGADDQDHDDLPNLLELSRNAASGLDDRGPGTCTPAEGLPTPPATNHPDAYGRVNPFNPCLPASWSRTCDRHPGVGSSPAPFDGSPNWYALN